MRIQRINKEKKKKWSLRIEKVGMFDQGGLGITWLKGGLASNTTSFWLNVHLFNIIIGFHYYGVKKK